MYTKFAERKRGAVLIITPYDLPERKKSRKRVQLRKCYESYVNPKTDCKEICVTL
jgi:hypothetical protein